MQEKLEKTCCNAQFGEKLLHLKIIFQENSSMRSCFSSKNWLGQIPTVPICSGGPVSLPPLQCLIDEIRHGKLVKTLGVETKATRKQANNWS